MTRDEMLAPLGAEAADNMNKVQQRAAAISAACNAVIEAAREWNKTEWTGSAATDLENAVRSLNELEGKK